MSDPADETVTDETVTDVVARRRRTPLLRVLVAVVLIAAMVATGSVLLVRAHDLRSVPAAANLAVVDPSATAEVSKQVSTALTQILTFDHDQPDATKTAAEKALTGAARRQYGQLFAALLQQAGSQQLTLSTKVDKVGVERLSDSSASLLVFLDQKSTRGTDGKANVAAAQLTVTAVKRDGRWLISGLDPL